MDNVDCPAGREAKENLSKKTFIFYPCQKID